MNTADDRITVACDCKVCNGRRISGPRARLTAKTRKATRILIHNYVYYTYSDTPLGRAVSAGMTRED